MTKFTVIALALSFCALMFAGCCTATRPGSCGCLEGNVCGWQFYKPADLVEGQVNCGSRDLCAQPCCPQPCCAPGVPFSQTTVAPAVVAPADAAAADEAAPFEEEIEDTDAP